jgi:hypothetical protein
MAVEGGLDLKPTAAEARRPSLITRIKSSMSTYSTLSTVPRRQSVVLADFLSVPEGPEKRFIDAVGMVIPGVSDRKQCVHPVSHFVIDWRLCAPIEYTTALADHGITFSDYCLLLDALANFCNGMANEQKPVGSYSVESAEQYRKTELQALSLNELLAEITTSWRMRGLPVMVCVGSFSLFGPHRITEAHIQILHVPVGPRGLPHSTERLSFIDPFIGESKPSQDSGERSVSMPHRKLSDPSVPIHVRSQGFSRDRSRPLPLWPNAIPTSKRELIDTHVGRYAVDPYFREYMRANVDSRPNSASYAKYMIEREDNPFINTRLDYINSPSKKLLLKCLFTRAYKKWSELNTNVVNRDRYEHNRKLECRKTVELGSRLRILRFGFRHPLFPPHTPEMTELGFDQAKYEEIISHISSLRQHENPLKCGARFMSFGRHHRTEDSMAKVSEYIRKLNSDSVQSKVIWTIEKIPGVYDGFLRSGKEWEISAWNAEDPLELLLQLEKWGVIEKKLDIDDEE